MNVDKIQLCFIHIDIFSMFLNETVKCTGKISFTFKDNNLYVQY